MTKDKRYTVRVVSAKNAKHWGYDGPVLEISDERKGAVFAMDSKVRSIVRWLTDADSE